MRATSFLAHPAPITLFHEVEWGGSVHCEKRVSSCRHTVDVVLTADFSIWPWPLPAGRMRPLDSEHPASPDAAADSQSITASARLDREPPEQGTAERAPDSETSPDDAGADSAVQQVGVLFVHGMGKHQRGDFLQQIGEPLYRWMAAWIGHGDPDAADRHIRARESSFRVAHRDDKGAPAHSLVETVVPNADGRRYQITWLAVDGWWNDEVVPPSFGQVASWSLGLAPWMIVRYFSRHWRGVLVVPSLILVVLFQMMILALSVFGAVPKLRSSVAGLQLRIAGSVGDVMVMVANPLQFGAITTRIASDLDWLHEQMPEGRIAVVAHSQGTGVAHAALQSSHVPVDLLVTFGTALEKLHVAREIQQNQRRIALGSSLTIAGGVLLALAADIIFRMQGPDLTASASIVGRWLMGAGAVLLMARMGLWFQLRRLGGLLLTAAGIAILLLGLALATAVWTLPGDPWRASLRALTVSGFWEAWTGNGWRSAALGLTVLGLALVVLRECVAIATRTRYVAGGPAPNSAREPGSRGGPTGVVFDSGSAAGNYAGAAALIGGLLCFALATPPDQSAEGNTILLLVVAGLAFCFAAVPLPVANLTEPTARDFRLPRREGRMRWHNYWAAADPVPDGNLPIGAVPYVTNHEVHNRGSIMADHTTYVDNREEFLADLTTHLAEIAGWAAIHPDDAAAITRAQHRRRWRVGFLMADRWLTSVGIVAACWILGSAGLTVLGEPVVAVIGYFVGILPGIESQDVEQWLPEALLGVLTVTAIASFWFRCVVTPAWRYWDLVEAEILSRRERVFPALSRERNVAVALFALASATGLCTAVWSPNLLQRAIDLRRVHSIPDSSGEGGWATLLLRWPWQRDVLLHTGPWSLSVPVIGIAILVVTILYAVIIRASIGAYSRRLPES